MLPVCAPAEGCPVSPAADGGGCWFAPGKLKAHNRKLTLGKILI